MTSSDLLCSAEEVEEKDTIEDEPQFSVCTDGCSPDIRSVLTLGHELLRSRRGLDHAKESESFLLTFLTVTFSKLEYLKFSIKVELLFI